MIQTIMQDLIFGCTKISHVVIFYLKIIIILTYVILFCSADFGFARFLEEGNMAVTLCGSPMYMVIFTSILTLLLYRSLHARFFCIMYVT